MDLTNEFDSKSLAHNIFINDCAKRDKETKRRKKAVCAEKLRKTKVFDMLDASRHLQKTFTRLNDRQMRTPEVKKSSFCARFVYRYSWKELSLICSENAVKSLQPIDCYCALPVSSLGFDFCRERHLQ